MRIWCAFGFELVDLHPKKSVLEDNNNKHKIATNNMDIKPK
jgi:hypothetical protein